MKLSFWDILASMVMLGGLALATIFINIFINPYSFINPFPPPTPVASLLVPTLTPSQRALPDVWTPTVGTPENTPLPGTYQSSGTPTVTGTKFVLPSYTPSVVRTLGPMYTLTKAPIRTSTSSYKTSTKTSEPSDTTKPTNPGHPFTISSSSDPEPVWLWTGSKDSDSGMAYYQVTWGGDSNCSNKVYKLYVNMFTAPTITSGGTYYICVRAVDQAGNQTSWIKGESSFTYNGPAAPSSTTVGATSITSTSAVLNGTVNAHWYDTTVTFRYGPTTSYGTTVSAVPPIVSGSTSTGVTYTVSGLTPHTTYHFRVYATNAAGSTNGADLTFTTLSNPSITTINSISVEPSTVGQSYAVAVTVAGTGTPTGTVAVNDGSVSCTVTLAAGTGSCNLTSVTAGTKTITATYGGDGSNASSVGTASHTVNKGTPVVSLWPTASTITYGQTLASSTLSGGSAIPTGTFAWITPATVPVVGTSAQPVRFTPTNSANYDTVDGTVNVTVNKATPTITFGATVPASPAYLGADITVSASTTNTDDPSLTYTYVSGPCTQASANTFTPTGPGACVVQADGAATANFNAATNTQSITITKATPVITFDAAPTVTYGDANFIVNATTTNTDDPTLTYSRVSGPCAGTTATFTVSGAGTCVVRATGAASTNFTTATEDQSVTIAKAAQTITFTSSNPGTVVVGDPSYTVSATSDSSLTVVFTVSGACTISGGNTVNFNNGTGTCTVRANQAGNTNYDPASEETQDITVN